MDLLIRSSLVIRDRPLILGGATRLVIHDGRHRRKHRDRWLHDHPDRVAFMCVSSRGGSTMSSGLGLSDDRGMALTLTT